MEPRVPKDLAMNNYGLWHRWYFRAQYGFMDKFFCEATELCLRW